MAALSQILQIVSNSTLFYLSFDTHGSPNLLKVAFFHKALMHFHFLKQMNNFIFLSMKIWIFVIFKAVLGSQ